MPPEHVRTTDGETPGRAGYADSAVLLVSLPSLDLLHSRLVEQGREPLPMDRFRPDIVVDGWGEPHTEHRLRRVTIGSARFGYAKLAIHCSVTMVDQTKLAVLQAGKLAVGDELKVGHWAAATR